MKSSVKNNFLLIYLVLVISIIIIMTIIFGNISLKITENAIITHSYDIATLHANIVSQKIDNHISALTVIAYSKDGTLLNKENIQQHIDDLTASNKYIFKSITFESKHDLNNIPNKENSDSLLYKFYFPEKRSPYSKKYIISDPIFNEEEKCSVIKITVPIYNRNNDLKGILSSAITLRDLSHELSGMTFEDNYYGMITDQRGYIIAHPQYEFYEKINIKNLEEYGIKNFDDFANDVMTLPKGIGKFYNEITQSTNIYNFVTIPLSPNWKLGIVAVQRDIMSTAYHLMVAISFISFTILAITIIVTTRLTSKITLPIIKVTDAVKNSRLINIQDMTFIQRSKELQEFATSYNNMLISLNRHTKHLEEMVRERTQELNLANQKLHSLATTDSLTKIINRNQIYEELFSLKKASDNNPPNPFSILFIDLDNFKYYNDTFGHNIGDKILIEIANDLKNILDSEDILGRYGGDEFIIILPQRNLEDAMEISNKIIIEFNKFKGYREKLQTWLDREKITIPREKILSLSIGYACYDNNYNNLDQLIKDADSKMYEMKKKEKSLKK